MNNRDRPALPDWCPKCGRSHRTWRTLTECLLKPLLWVSGSGPYASVSDCPRGRTVQLYDAEDEAFAAKAFIDRFACGGVCRRRHRVVRLGDDAIAARKQPLVPQPGAAP